MAYLNGEITIDANKAGIRFNNDDNQVRVCLEMSLSTDFWSRRTERFNWSGKVGNGKFDGAKMVL